MSIITFTPKEVSIYYAKQVPHLKQSQAPEWRGPCPIHHGKSDNFTVNPNNGIWFCHSKCGFGGDILKLEAALTCETDFETCKTQVFQLVGRTEFDSSHDSMSVNSHGAAFLEPANTHATDGWKEIERYPYQDAEGNLLFEVVRYLKPDGQKDFRQCRPDGQGGVIWGLGDTERVPYRLPKVIKAETVYLAEGEKDVHTLENWGLVGSCNSGGSGSSKLYMGWAKYFAGCHLVILPDNDPAGRKHAAAVATALLSVAASTRVVELPGLPPKGDVTDWRDAGGTFKDFCKLTEAAPPLNPVQLSALLKSWALAGQKAQPNGRTNVLATRRLSDIEAKPVSWLWPGRIARGKVSIIAGSPGLGKSQIAAYIAAIVTSGGMWAVEHQKCEIGSVVFLNGEDDPADTIRPRLSAAGADLKRVVTVDGVKAGYSANGNSVHRPFTLEEDLQTLDGTLSELGDVAVVIIDPITAYLGKVDSHKNADVRALLAPLSDLAAKHNTAMIGISHLTKACGSPALMRVSGSLAFVAAARAAFLVGADEQDKSRRLFVPMKNNIGPDDKGLAFRIESAIVETKAGPLSTSRVVWDPEPVSETADEVLQSDIGPQSGSALVEATEWLQAALADGPVSAAKIKEEAKAAGISQITLRRATKKVCAKPQKSPTMNGGWLWSLLPNLINAGEVAQHNSMSTFGHVEHLPDVNGFADML
jgi:putative DNA primase/helicase